MIIDPEVITMSKISSFLASLKANFITASVIFILLGVILIIFPGQVANIACYVLGALLIAAGVLLIIKFFSLKGVSSFFSITLVCGIIFSAIGLFMIIRSDLVIAFIPFIFGIVAIIDGIIGIQRAILLAKANFKIWWLALIFSIVVSVLGIIMAVNPFESGLFVFRFIGICLVFNGLIDIWGILSFSKFFKSVKPEDYTIEDNSSKY